MARNKTRAKIDLAAPPIDDNDLDQGAPDLSADGDEITVSKDYIKKLRQEAAQRRVQVRAFTDYLGKYNESEVRWMLETAELLVDNPTEAIGRYKELVNLYDPEGKTPEAESHPKQKEGEEDPNKGGEPPVDDKNNGKDPQLDKSTLEAMLEAQKRDIRIEQIRREMTLKAIERGFEEGTPQFHMFMGLVAGNDGDFDKATDAYGELVGKESERIASSKKDLNEQFPGRGRASGPVMPPHEAPKTLAEAREAAAQFFASQPGQ